MKYRRFLCLMLALLLVSALLPAQAASAYSAEKATLTFSDGGVTIPADTAGVSVSGTALSITASGTYRVTGACREGSIAVGKGLDVTLILDNLNLRAGATAPITVKKDSRVLLILEGESTLTDDEDASTEETNEDYEGACVKVKTGSSLTVWGSGVLNAAGNAKNGLKGAAETALTVDGGTVNVTAANNAVAFDGSVTVNAGALTLTAGNDGIKAVPDETDTVSAGTVTVNGGSVTVRAQGDAIHAASDLTVTGGSFDLQTMDGYQTRGFNANTMSAKGLKASCDLAEGEEASNRIVITGGDFRINTVDDAIHSDATVDITGGSFEIYTADDGVHAETTLTLGAEGGYERDPEITIRACYEGLEGCIVDSYSGKYYIIASDDGVNAAGGSSNGTDPGGPWGPGGGGGWGPGGGWNPGGPGGGGPGGGGFPGGGGSENYKINFYGGSYYVDCQGDGLDSNGDLNMYGGNFSVLSMASGGDNSPLDADGTIRVKGATVFGAGSRGLGESPSSDSQKYYTDSTRRNAGTVVNVSYGGKVVFSETLVRNINYLFYSSPDMTSTSCTVAAANAVTACQGNAFAHSFDGGTVETAATSDSPGVLLYTCTACGATERKTVPQLPEPAVYEPEETEPEEPAVYTASFVTDGHASIDVYYKQEYTQPDETDVQSAVARNSATGGIDGTGDGQINFAVRMEAGYALDSVTVEGSYKNLKDLSEGGEIKNLFRVTKIAGDLTITVKTVKIEPSQCEHEYVTAVTAPTCTAQGFTTYTCSKCGDSYAGDEVAALGHSFGQWSTTKAATCTAGGEQTRTCASCGEKQTRETDALGHDYKAVVTAPTCTAKGYTTYTCSRCGDKYIGNETDALGHDWGEGTITTEPTETSTGVRTYTCSRCGEKKTETIPELSHVHSYTAVVTAPTCTEAGFTTYTCACGDSYVGDEVAALAHDYRDGKCTRCGASDPDYVPPDPFRFDDVKDESQYYYEPVYWAVEQGITNGTSKTEFSPEKGCTRAQVVTFLWRAAGEPKPTATTCNFEDVKKGAYYYDAVLWAVENNITNGTSKTTFDPEKTCTRAQIVTFLWRAAKEPKPTATTCAFNDVKAGAYYYDAVLWAVEKEITNGTSKNTFDPEKTCTRAQIVTFLYRAK